MATTLFVFALLLASVAGDCSSGAPVMSSSWDGQCGSAQGRCCPSGYCCSQYGYCGQSGDYCGSTCQVGYGMCSSDGSTSTATTQAPQQTTQAPTQPATNPPSSSCGNCITKQMLININKQSSYWGNCDTSQPAKPNAGGALATDGLYCTDSYVQTLNQMLCDLNYCNNLAAKQMFIGQVTHESAYFTKFYQPIDAGRGALNMVPGNMPQNTADIDQIWPGSNAEGQLQGDSAGVFLTTPAYAWKSAAAWFLRTNSMIPGCGLNLFLQDFNTVAICIFGHGTDPGYNDRYQAYLTAQTYVTASADTSASSMTSAPSFTLLACMLAIVMLLKRTA